MSRVFEVTGAPVRIHFEGTVIEAQPGDTVAAALLGAGIRQFRTTALSDTPRGPLCMMGVCFDCLVEIDGKGNQQACMHEVRDGMRVSRQKGAFDVTSALSFDPEEDT
ncbi:(2Fe-2S)-binding protein [Ruegeria pomeroyi]|uniref:(2Fe-2S)-binding protein n=1 Tax=Ruegeria alba TaxID=2916756 RepID=A0ABS9P1D8_9RHOB|nr:(2Fe-2S)-binding protein [Ruegeria alba]MCE8515014.1 (2Fe-2S)-binding protein [Ruegeria pomeroyi]MCE8516657.1 (2Fe-2S)-binding protein [Ruegeria pomeroyi]MCE8521329.1 (2Fe-2S)-binding protein [Ruegeria pomeroyi]MCE8531656.1 (2Fe-2S)-binding protein [Ruegeria pomeroyi]MCE8534187.1 (2Fe-2S)-binding protein [Ruegeria pomeroyi]